MNKAANQFNSSGPSFGACALKSFLFVGVMLAFAAPRFVQGAENSARPKVRAITAFIRLDRSRYESQIQDTLKMLHAAKSAMEQGGYEVESIRITTQPFPEYVRGLSKEQALAFFHAYDDLAAKESFIPNIGPAMLQDDDDVAHVELLGEILSSTTNLEGSVHTADDDGIHWKAVRAAAKMVKYVEEQSPRSQGNFNFAAAAMVAPYGPFYPASYHTGAGHQFAVGLESANVVQAVFAANSRNPEAARTQLLKALTKHARVVEAIALRVEKQTGWKYMGLDPTTAPLMDVSIGDAIEKFTGAKFGSSGTLTAAAIITRAVRAVPVKQVGYSGLMLPVLEDKLLARRWTEGTYSIDALLAYSSVCATGLDTVPLPGDVTENQIARIIGDVASLAFKWHKPLTARLQPVLGKNPGEQTNFQDPYLANATLQPLP
jgi:uncharacterized protein (UPF0210 family)